MCVRRGVQQLCLKTSLSCWDRTPHRQRDILCHQEGYVLSPTPSHSVSSERPTQSTKWMQKQFICTPYPSYQCLVVKLHWLNSSMHYLAFHTANILMLSSGFYEHVHMKKHHLFSGLFSLCQFFHHPVHLVIIVGVLLIQKWIKVEKIAVSIKKCRLVYAVSSFLVLLSECEIQ